MSKGSWRRSKSKEIPDKKVADEWDRLFPDKKAELKRQLEDNIALTNFSFGDKK